MVPHAPPPVTLGRWTTPRSDHPSPPRKKSQQDIQPSPKNDPLIWGFLISDLNPSPQKNRQKLIRNRWNIHHRCSWWPQRLLCTARRITKAVLQSSSKLNLRMWRCQGWALCEFRWILNGENFFPSKFWEGLNQHGLWTKKMTIMW